jgi:hypothetical protein
MNAHANYPLPVYSVLPIPVRSIACSFTASGKQLVLLNQVLSFPLRDT